MYVKAGVTPGWSNARVVDATTGEEIRYVVDADDEAGWLLRYPVDAEGNPLLAPDRKSLVEERLTGLNIRIEGMERVAA